MKRLLRSLVLSLFVAAQAGAGQVDLSDKPLANGVSANIKPNIMFVLDDSGSMGWNYLPDGVNSNNSRPCFANHLYNRIYFNPDYTYPLPVDASGSPLTAASFNGARTNGFNSSSGTTDLRSRFTMLSDDSQQAAYYYSYSGGGTPTAGTCYADNKYTKVTVSEAQKQNFANWYSYYRTRILMMKSALSLAFKGIDSKYRVGYMSINNRTGSDYSNMATFDSAGKSAFYQKVFAASTGNGTGLRWALTTAGQLYAGQLNGQSFWGSNVVDPIQYSCQQNFTILATDGYWNSQTTGMECSRHEGCKIDGTTIGNQDGTAAKPQWDGTTVTHKVVEVFRRYTYYLSNCSGGNKRVKQQEQRKTVTTTTINGVTGAPVDTGWVNQGSATNYTTCQNPAPAVPADTEPVLLSSTPTDTSSGGSSGTLADVAQYYYMTDLRDGALSNCTGALGLNVCNNNVPGAGRDTAAHQHMTTFTLGLGIDGTLRYADNYESCGTACDYPDIVQGNTVWPTPSSDDPTAVDDLWHAAVNGRGTYYSAKTPDALSSGLTKALSGVNARTGAGGAAATSTLAPVQGDQYAYVALYTTVYWTGDLQQRTISLTTGEVSETPTWSAQTQLDGLTGAASDSRTIYTPVSGDLRAFNTTNLTTYIAAKNFSAGSDNPNGQLSQYGSFDSTLQGQSTGATGAANMINFLRGWRGNEDTAGNTYRIYRSRAHVLGDIVDSSPVYVNKPAFDYTENNYKNWTPNRTATIYTAANDGMLHALNAATGNERWAFIPSKIVPYLYKLADTNYANNHRFYIDGHLTVGDAYFNNAWHTVLIGGLGKGGRSYFALDITGDTPSLLWEFSVDNDNDLGYTYGGAQIGKRASDGKWVAWFASGYNNTSPGDGKGRLYVVDLATGAKLSEIVASEDSDPASSGIGWVNGWTDAGMADNTVRHVYAGDMGGNVWRFDITSNTVGLLATVGKVAGAPVQPITTRPELGDVLDSSGGQQSQRVIYVGTGRYYGDGDIANTDMQSFYAIRDDGNSLKNWGNFRTQPGVKAFDLTGSGTSRNIAYQAVAASGVGWYMDFDAQNGERVVVNPRLFNGDQKTLTVITGIPDPNSYCDVGGTSFVYFVETQPTSTHNSVSGTVAYIGKAMAVGAAGVSLPGGKLAVIVNLSDGTTVTISPPTTQGSNIKRATWRELIN
jgi:type IV pilus assembly protein PilY1